MFLADINQQMNLKASQSVKKTVSHFKLNQIKMDHIGVYYGCQRAFILFSNLKWNSQKCFKTYFILKTVHYEVLWRCDMGGSVQCDVVTALEAAHM